MILLPFGNATFWGWCSTALAGWGALGGIIWISHLVHLIYYRGRVVFLADLDWPLRPSTHPNDAISWSKVALIFAARNEAGGVEAATRSMLGATQLDPDVQVVAVDDRSTDRTGAILDELANEYAALTVVHVTNLPAGWLGKTNALQIGAATVAADVAWLLFTDADVVFQPGTVRRAVAHAQASGLDHVTVAPEVDTESVGERIFLSLFGLLFSLYAPLGRLNDRRSRAHIGIGAFNLVRAEAFQAIGGFRHLSLSIDDDMRLGQTLKNAGYSMQYLLGRGALSVRWQSSTWGMVRGIEKNFFAGLKFQMRRVVAVILGLGTLGVAPFLAIGIGPPGTRILAGLGVASILILLKAAERQSRIAWYYGCLLPGATCLILVALCRSTLITLRNQGITWRDHFYPLAILKAHVQQRDAWLAELWRSTR